MSKEETIRAELYRVLKNSIEKGISYEDYKISTVAVEYPIDGKKADLVVFFNYKSEPIKPLLVIETKRRVKYPAKPLAKATIQAMQYAEKLQSFFFAVYDGWNFLLLVKYDPYLIRLSTFLHIEESLMQNLLLGLLELYRHPFYSKTLERLPKIPDGWSFHQTIMPAIAKSLASMTTPKREDSWKILLGKWYPIIQEDGKW